MNLNHQEKMCLDSIYLVKEHMELEIIYIGKHLCYFCKLKGMSFNTMKLNYLECPNEKIESHPGTTLN